MATDDKQLCGESYCPACGAQCQRRQDHQGQHDCINCGTKWSDEVAAVLRGLKEMEAGKTKSISEIRAALKSKNRMEPS